MHLKEALFVPVSFSIDSARRRVFIKLEGEVGVQEVADALVELWALPEHDGSFDRLVDATEVTRPNVTAEAVWTIARQYAGRMTGRLALVASSDAAFGLLRMYETYADHPCCETFRSMDDAIAWFDSGRREQPQR